jgi:hypothetical protein
MVTPEGIIIMLEEDVQKVWNFHNEQLKLKKLSLKGNLHLVQLNSLYHFYASENCFPYILQ